jgi:hypothetical protein
MANKISIPQMRLINQHILAPEANTVKQLVGWMGAVQSQDYQMAKWGIGLRVQGSTESVVEAAIDNAEIIRTHILRPTWHFVTATDARWMMSLTAGEVNKKSGTAFRQFDLDAEIFKKTQKLLQRILKNGNHLTRKEIVGHFEKAGIKTADLRTTYILFKAELDMVVCNGKRRGKQFTYALFDERVPAAKSIDRKSALAKLAKIYFASHGPATLRDFEWWSGLLLSDARAGLESIRPELHSVSISNRDFWFYEPTAAMKKTSSMFLLPAYDEYTISYADRTDVLDKKYSKDVLLGHGIFSPVVVVNGQVEGIWKKTEKKDTIHLQPKMMNRLGEVNRKKLETVARRYGKFLGKPVVVD